jgi:pimeloyl-ACP methyl ester carboxylesterase
VGDERIHRVTSDDGTEIAGHVRGQGSPLVLVHGGLGDGSPDMTVLLPFLEQHFTCHLMATRGRGLSTEHPDHARERHYEDVATFIEGVGEPVSVFGHSSGGAWVIGGAARAAASCRAVALYEPALPVARPLIDDDTYARCTASVADGRPADAARVLIDEVIEAGQQERALFVALGVPELVAPLVPVSLRELPELNRPIDVESLAQLTMPVLLLQGSLSADRFEAAVSCVAAIVHHARVVEIPGAGHFGPETHSEVVADALIAFFKG